MRNGLNSCRQEGSPMFEEILITQLNDFIFCPASIYFHNLYGETDKMVYQSTQQINGTAAHKSVDQATYTTRKDILMGIDVYSEEYGLIGKIDMFDVNKGILTERKRQVKVIYDGYYFQVFAQCFGLREASYIVNQIKIHSIADNKNYDIPLPEKNITMLKKFQETIEQMHTFKLDEFEQTCPEKCRNCIYEPACDRGVK